MGALVSIRTLVNILSALERQTFTTVASRRGLVELWRNLCETEFARDDLVLNYELAVADWERYLALSMGGNVVRLTRAV